MLPTVVIVALNIDPTQTLVISQVILSLVLPVPVIALFYFTSKKQVMGVLVNTKTVSFLSTIAAALILLLNIYLIFQTLI